MKLEGKKLDIVSVTGNTQGGKVDVNGYVVFEGLSYKDYEVDVKATNANIEAVRDVSGVVNANAVVKKGAEMVNVSGNIQVVKCLLTVPFRMRTIPLAAVRHNASYDLTITGDRNIWLRNRDVNIEMGTDVRVRWQPGTMTLSGVMNIIGGRIYYLGFTQPFDVTTGEFTFSNSPELNPTLNVQAEAIVEPLDVEAVDTVNLSVSGTMLEPVFSLSSGSLTQTQILLLLGLNLREMGSLVGSEIFAAGGGRGMEYLQNIVMRELEKAVGLDEIRLKTELFGSNKSAKVTVGRYIGKDVFVAYSHDLFAPVKDEYKVEYYLGKGSSIIGSRDDLGRYNMGLGFKIKY
jgi:autotransporter translocation and assembly factor TamB